MAVATSTSSTTTRSRRSGPVRAHKLLQLNWFGGLAGWIWLAIVLIPLYWIVATSFKDQSAYFTQNPFALPSAPTANNYKLVIQSDFPRYFLNSVIVTAGTIIPAVAISFMAAYA